MSNRVKSRRAAPADSALAETLFRIVSKIPAQEIFSFATK